MLVYYHRRFPFGIVNCFFLLRVWGEKMYMEKSNFILGTVGAFIGSLIGVFTIVFLKQLGYVAVISGFIMGISTCTGYSKLGKALDVKGIIISIVIMIIMIYMANRLNWVFEIIREIPGAGFFKTFVNFNSILKLDPKLTSKYFESLFMDYGLCGFGAIIYICCVSDK